MKHYNQIINHFKKQDPLLFSYIKHVPKFELLKKAHPRTYFYRLCREIAYQQLSDKAGHAIFSRFESLFPNHHITPTKVINTLHETIRNVGLSHAKARYIHHLAEKAKSREFNFSKIDALENEEVIKKLTQVKGIGRWTAEMFLMFTLARENIFSHGDLGLRKAIQKIYDFKKEPTKNQIEQIIEKWSPYKTYGCCVLWKTLEINKN